MERRLIEEWKVIEFLYIYWRSGDLGGRPRLLSGVGEISPVSRLATHYGASPEGLRGG